MSAFQRKGTVSKSSGSTHLNSYALKGIPVKYGPPVFVPDLMRLPANWKPPALPSEDLFRYDYSREIRVLEQAKIRALSVVAEAEASRQQQENEQPDTEKDLANSQPQRPVLPMFSSTILTPTPVTTTTNNGANNMTNETSTGVNIKSLGQLSIREFEGDDYDPFEIASLQAINDMEVLQSVLQPTVVSTSSSSGSTASSSPSQGSQPQLPQPSTKPQQAVHASGSTVLIPPVVTSSVCQPQPSIPLPMESALTNPFQSGPFVASSTTVSYASTLNQPPHISVSSPTTVINTTNPFATGDPSRTNMNQTVAASEQEPEVGTLIDFETEATPPALQGSQVTPVPIPQGRASYNAIGTPSGPNPATTQQQVSPPAFTSSSDPVGAFSIPVSGPPPMPPKSQQTTPVPTTGPPPIPPKPQPAAASSFPHVAAVNVIPLPPKPLPVTSPPSPHSSSINPLPIPPKGVHSSPRTSPPPPTSSSPLLQARVNALVANLPVVPNRPGLGVAVLPPIHHMTTPDPLPPALPPRRATPPPPYFPEQVVERSRQPPPQPAVPPPFRLQDPQSSMSSEEKTEVKSISGMGFPLPRVARAVKRTNNDRTKVLDFLFLIGRVEDLGYNGDSAEVALLANEDDVDKAINYLEKVEGYKDIGFSEKAVHEAYEKANGDWDQALDILTQQR